MKWQIIVIQVTVNASNKSSITRDVGTPGDRAHPLVSGWPAKGCHVVCSEAQRDEESPLNKTIEHVVCHGPGIC